MTTYVTPASMTPLQLVVLALEALAFLGGIGAWAWYLMRGAARLREPRLGLWHAGAVDLATGLCAIVLGALGLQTVLAAAAARLTSSADQAALMQGAGFQLGMLAGVLVTLRLIRKPPALEFQCAAAAEPPARAQDAAPDATEAPPALPSSCVRPPAPLSGWRAAGAGVAVFAMALPLMTAVAAVWQWVMTLCGREVRPQELLGLFARIDSPWWIMLMTVMAVIVAPLTEELIFRGGLFRFLRQRTPLRWALLLSGAAFAAVHLELTVFGPLCVLGMLLACAYERTGSLLTPMVAHALFNLNTLVLLLSGLGPPASS